MLITSAERIWRFSRACWTKCKFSRTQYYLEFYISTAADGKKCEKPCMKFKKLSTFPHTLCTAKISYALQKFIFNIFLTYFFFYLQLYNLF